MQPETLGLLTDIQEATQFIADETGRVTYDEFLNDQRTRQAVLFSFLIIGEAVNKLSRVDPATVDRISAVPRIVGLRNSLIHGCRSINYRTVWRTIHESLPVLRAEIDQLLGESEAGER
jgi:uncharacterized protein with HEPN domain